jgi:hypothetical protein
MIWIWICDAVIWLLKLIIPPPPKPVIPQIDQNAPCPSCGHCEGELSAVERDSKMMVQHRCLVCKAKWWENPVLKSFEPTASTSAAVKMEAPAPAKE